jgi:predicted lipoprotein with Yx(FWY)xxD motif
MKQFIALLAITAFATLASGCGGGDSDGEGAASAAQPTGTADDASGGAPPASTVARHAGGSVAPRRGPHLKAIYSEYGRVIADTRGEALYLFDREKKGRSECYGACADAWPPLLANAGPPVAGGGASQELLGTTRRRNGDPQVTYGGQPLYYYVHDSPGEILCNDVAEFGGLWLVVRPSGKPAA